jgi:hypothetical protein
MRPTRHGWIFGEGHEFSGGTTGGVYNYEGDSSSITNSTLTSNGAGAYGRAARPVHGRKADRAPYVGYVGERRNDDRQLQITEHPILDVPRRPC